MGNLTVDDFRRLIQGIKAQSHAAYVTTQTQCDMMLSALQEQMEEPQKPRDAWFGAGDNPIG